MIHLWLYDRNLITCFLDLLYLAFKTSCTELCAETDRKSITYRLWFCKIYSRLIFFSIYNDNTEKKDIIVTSVRICQRSDRWWTSQETRSVSVWHEACGSASQPLFLNERVRQTALQLLQSALRWSGKGLSRQGTMTLISYENISRLNSGIRCSQSVRHCYCWP